MLIENGFVKEMIKRLLNYKTLGDKTFEQLDEKDLWMKASPESNSISVIIQHMSGNMLSRFTNFLTEDGEKPWRDRDEEFKEMNLCKEELFKRWNAGWDCVFSELKKLNEADLTKTIYIRSEPLIVYDAILRQLAHYAYHVGQIVFTGKMITDKNWQSLSISKVNSDHFNTVLLQKN